MSHKHNLATGQQVSGRPCNVCVNLVGRENSGRQLACNTGALVRVSHLAKTVSGRRRPVWVHAQVHTVLGLIPGCIRLLLGSPGPPDEVHITAVVLRMALGVLQAESVLGGFQGMLLKLAEHILLLPHCRSLVCASFAEGLHHCLHNVMLAFTSVTACTDSTVPAFRV